MTSGFERSEKRGEMHTYIFALVLITSAVFHFDSVDAIPLALFLLLVGVDKARDDVVLAIETRR